MAAGAYMAGKIPAVLMQNSGLGTSLNTLDFLEYDVSAALHFARVLARVSGQRCPGTPRDGRDHAAIARYDEDSPSHCCRNRR